MAAGMFLPWDDSPGSWGQFFRGHPGASLPAGHAATCFFGSGGHRDHRHPLQPRLRSGQPMRQQGGLARTCRHHRPRPARACPAGFMEVSAACPYPGSARRTRRPHCGNGICSWHGCRNPHIAGFRAAGVPLPGPRDAGRPQNMPEAPLPDQGWNIMGQRMDRSSCEGPERAVRLVLVQKGRYHEVRAMRIMASGLPGSAAGRLVP